MPIQSTWVLGSSSAAGFVSVNTTDQFQSHRGYSYNQRIVGGGSGPIAGSGRLLEDGTSFRLLQDGTFRLLQA